MRVKGKVRGKGRDEEGEKKSYTVRLDDLIKDAHLSANVDMNPGDILIIP